LNYIAFIAFIAGIAGITFIALQIGDLSSGSVDGVESLMLA